MLTKRLLTPLVAATALLVSSAASAQDAPRRAPRAAPPTRVDPPPRSAPVAAEDEAGDEGAVDEEAPEDEAPMAEAAEPAEPAEAEVEAEAVEVEEVARPPEAASEPAEPEAAPATVVTTAPGACAPDQLRQALDAAEAAIVHVEAPGALGIGVLFHSRRHVLTTLSIVDAGRGVKVHVGGGRGRDARVVAFDRDHDLALLELDSAVSAPPLGLTSRDVAVGAPVMAVVVPADRWAQWGKWMRGKHDDMRVGEKRGPLGEPVAQPGQLTSLRGDVFRTDALDGRHVSWGAPILTCDGRLAGLAINPFTDEVTGPGAIRTLAREVSGEEAYGGRWSGFHPSFAVVGQMDHAEQPGFGERDMWLGFSVGNSIIGHDRWILPARFGASFLMGPDFDVPFTKRRGYRLQGQVGLGYRAMLHGGRVPVYLVPQVGFTLMYERVETSQTFFEVDGCGPAGGACGILPYELSVIRTRVRPLPTAGGSLQIGFADLQYQLQIDPEGFDRSIHQVSIGGQW